MRHGRHYAMGNTAETRLYGRTVTPLRQGRRAAGCALPHSENAATIVFRHDVAGDGFAGVRAKRAAGGAGFGTGRRTTRSLITTSADGAGRRAGVGVDVPLVDRAGGGVSVRRWIIGPTTPRPSASEAAETEPTTRATMSQPDLGEPSTVGE